MGPQQPFLYNAEQRGDSRFPASSFDPKAVTRASWEPKPARPKQDGPLLSFNRHPDSHMVLSHRSHLHSPMSPWTKSCIKWFRRMQLLLRLIQLNGAMGTLVLMILLDNIATVTGWIMRITPGVIIAHCLYALYHLSRDPAGRAPASSAAYQAFSVVVDMSAIGLYVYGVLVINSDSRDWATRLPDKSLTDILVQAVYYILITTAGLHATSFCISVWLAWAFRKISLMPPDMNPLEDHLTARPMHKRKKSSVTTLASTENEPSADPRHRSQMSQGSLPASLRVPFMHTRANSSVSQATTISQANLPARHYQITPANTSRQSVASMESKRMHYHTGHRGSYSEVPLDEPLSERTSNRAATQRVGKFTEAWVPTDSLVSRTNQKNRKTEAAVHRNNNRTQTYSAISQSYDLDESSDSDFGDENDLGNPKATMSSERDQRTHPNPLRSNPAPAAKSVSSRAQTPFYPTGLRQSNAGNSLSELSSNQRHVTGGKDIADESVLATGMPWMQKRHETSHGANLKPYGRLGDGIAHVKVGVGRKVSSGTDFDSRHSFAAFGRRNVSGRLAEEGRAGANR